MSKAIGIHIPPWLGPLLGEREMVILQAPDCRPMQCLPEMFEETEQRLPPGQQHLVSKSLKAYFTIDARQQKIIG